MRPAFLSRRFVPALSLWMVTTACAGLEPSGPPPGAVLMTPPPEYALWYAKTESCAGLQGSLEGIEWYVVPDVATFETSIGEKVGLWEKVGRSTRITLAGDYVQHEMVVRHEMLHDLLERTGHPPEYFVNRCHLTWDSWDAAEQ